MICSIYYILWIIILQYHRPNWVVPPHICALTTTRHGGISEGPYSSNNLALHVDDDQSHVMVNRNLLIKELALPSPPEWLQQTHSTQCILVDQESSRAGDAAYSRTPGCVLCIMTADCLPILLCNRNGTEIAAVHAGWRGLVDEVIENTIKNFADNPNNLCAWIGPAICGNCYEVGDEVRSKATEKDESANSAFIKSPNYSTNQPKWLANLPYLAELRLKKLGIIHIYQSNQCTYELSDIFYSYRKRAQTGRIASLIWINH